MNINIIIQHYHIGLTNVLFCQDVAFVIDGWALEIALKYYHKAFTELAILSRTAICCRVTPSQKAQVPYLLLRSVTVLPK